MPTSPRRPPGKAFDAAEHARVSRVERHEETPLFAPVIRTPAPVAPGSESSREAAELVSVDGEALRVLEWYAKQPEPRTRHQCAAAVYPVKPGVRDVVGVSSACGRVNHLVAFGYLEEVGRLEKRATLRITEAGRRWLAKRGVLAA